MFGFGKKGGKKGSATPEKVGAKSGAPLDFTHVDSREKAEALHREGQLLAMDLFPRELGGPADDPRNIIYVPPGIPALQQQLVGTIRRFVGEGLIDNLDVRPEYKGDSFVPSKVHYATSHQDKAGSFNPTIDIW